MKTLRNLMLIALLAVACKTTRDGYGSNEPLDKVYNRSINQAMIADTTKTIDTLQTITAGNPVLQWKTINGQQYVLMGTFMKYPNSFPPGDSINNSWGEMWLFIPNQMKYRLGSTFSPTSDTLLRLSQMLGLPPVNGNRYIAQVWVPAGKLYRPAGNPDVTTTHAGPVLSAGVSEEYKAWFNGYIISSYFQPLAPGGAHYPWTRMGYTYDWNPRVNRVGVSEFVLPKGCGIWVEKMTTAGGFFK
ncbi:hypothetical protein [Chitinophaga sp. LS1]|uniref:hypothetical protein n=1 Tax=Chitinophaga sp. LS1 TaxID=3051176 RepID=UPI002AABFDB8|nr:hypothetical protein [Chitinophaga sp. LS1]WPV68035.1 hypothetical protein QQL36_04765 [Chitinophaga sp. LS1]